MMTKKILLIFVCICVYCTNIHAQDLVAAFEIKGWQPAGATPDFSDFRLSFFFNQDPSNVLTEASTRYVTFSYGTYGAGRLFVELKMSGLGSMNTGWKIGWPFTITIQQVAHGTENVIGEISYNDVLPQQNDAWWADGVARPSLVLDAAAGIEIELSTGSLPLCKGATTGNQITATTSDGSTVSWRLAAGGSLPTGITGSGNTLTVGATTAPGTYSIVATSGNVVSGAVEIVVKPVPTIQPVLELPGAICLGEDVILSVSAATQETGVTYEWTPDNGNAADAMYTPDSKTTKYKVTPVLNGCPGTPSQESTLTFKPDLSAGAPSYVCDITTYQATVVMAGGPWGATDFQIWADENMSTPYTGAVQQEGNNLEKLTFSGLASGTPVSVYITSPKTCGSVHLTFNKTCSCSPALELTGGEAFCQGSDPKNLGVALTIPEADKSRFKVWEFKLKKPDGTYALDIRNERAETSWTHTPTAAGDYTLEGFKVYNADKSESCEGTISGSPKNVRIHPKPTVSLVATPDGVCAGNNLKLEATAGNGATPYSYIWTGTGAAGKITSTVNTTIVAGSTDYTVKVRDNNGCESEVSNKETVQGYEVKVTSVSAAVNSVNIGDATTLNCAVSLNPTTGHAIDSYQWTSNPAGQIDGDAAIKTPSTKALTGTTDFTVTVTDDKGCSDSKAVTVNVTGTTLTVGATGAEGCEGSTITLRCSPRGGATTNYTYTWESDNGLTFVDDQVQNPQISLTTPAGTYRAKVTVIEGNNTAVSDWVTVKVNQVPEISGLTSDAPGNTCIPGTTVHISLANAFGGAQLTWSSDPVGNIATVADDKMSVTTVPFSSDNRNYKFTVRATNAEGGCPVDSSIYINVRGSSLNIDFTNANVDLCQNEEKNLFPLVQVTGGVGTNYTYTWEVSDPKLKISATTGTNVKILSDSEPGSYTINVTVEDEDGHRATKALPVTITEKPVLSNIDVSKDDPIVGESVTLTVNISPTGVTPEWTGTPLQTTTGTSVSTGAFTTDGRFTYTVNARNGNCDAEPLQVTVVVKKQDAPIDITMNDVEGCAGTAIILSGSVNGGGSVGYNFKWESLSPGLTFPTEFGATNSIPANTLPGSYSIKVTASDATGARQNSKVLNVTVKRTPQITSAYATLEGQTDHVTNVEMGDVVELTATAEPVDADYQWSSTTGPLQLPHNQPTVSTGAITVTGQLVYTVEASKNGCSATENVVLNVKRPSIEGILRAEVDKKCANSGEQLTIKITADGGDSYFFTLRDKYGDPVKSVDGESGPTWEYKVSAADEGVYKLTDFQARKNGVNISSTIGTVEIPATFYPTPTVNAYTEAVMTHCQGDVLVLKATGDAGLTYEWDNDVQDGVGFIPTESKTYTVTATDSHECQNTSSVAVTLAEKPQVIVPEDMEVCKGTEVSLKATGNADTYTWNNNVENDVPFIPSKSANYVVEGKFKSTGCVTRDTVKVIVNQPPYIVAASKHERNIAIGKNVSMGVKVVGQVTGYQWQWKENGDWSELSDMTGIPTISGTDTDSLRLVNVPIEWDGTELRCVVMGQCGSADTTFLLHVKECFELAADLFMGSGIQPDTDPTNQIDGWYCVGMPITLNASLFGLDEEVEIENPCFTWKTDGRDFHEEHDPSINTNTASLTWVPQRWEDDVIIQVCAYSDGACDTVCSRILRLKARQPDLVEMQIVTSIDPERMFCPGDTVDLTVALKNEGRHSDIQWYRDIFDKGTGLRKQFVMDQKDTWVRAVLIPSEELCVEEAIMDSVFLKVKDFVHPTLEIDNHIHDTIACQGDTLLFEAIWSNAGENPQFVWQQDIWDRGTGTTAVIGMNDKDTWVKCTMVPGPDVCFDGTPLVDTMVVRVREAGTLTISVDMTGKQPGDELVFISEVENMLGTWNYSWYVDDNLTSCEEKDFVTDALRQGALVYCGISGNEVCMNKVFSNKIIVDYAGTVNRDTMLVIYRNENIKNLDMLKPSDQPGKVLFRIETPSLYGAATITPNGKFTYIPNTGFVGTDYVKYVILDRMTKEQMAEGYIYITVKDSQRFLIPNLITPNDDGLNDTWKLDFLSEYPNHRILVFDRNGTPVFEGKNYQNDWDGTGYTKGGYVGHINLVNGVYTYVIELGDENKTVLKSWIEIRANMNRRDYR